MEELFENKTKYTQKDYETFLEVHRKEYSLSENAYMIFNIVFFGMCMIFAFRNNEILLGVILLLGLLVYMWYKIIWPIKRIQKNQKGGKLSGNFVNTYKFYKRHFTVENPEGNAQIFYFKLYRIVETNENYYIYISRDNAFIVLKNAFTKGDTKEFTKFIRSKVFTKYRNRIKRCLHCI